MKEILSLHVGQAGCQIGNAVWELYTAEHSINSCGLAIENLKIEENNDFGKEAFFELKPNFRYVPRAIFIDTEPTVIDEINSGIYKNLFHPDYLQNSSEDSANIFSKAYFQQGSLMSDKFDRIISSMIENCESPHALMTFRSYSGGTGSGLTAALLDIVHENYPKLNNVEVSLLPKTKSHGGSDPIVSPYNSVLSLHYSMADMDNSILVDNDGLLNAVKTNLNFTHTSFSSINRFLAQACSNFTSSSRFETSLYNDFIFMQTNLIPYPRLHFPLVHYAPCNDNYRADFEIDLIHRITLDAFRSENSILSGINHFDGKFISCCLNYRGSICPMEVYNSLNALKLSSLQFVDWCPTSFKVGITNHPVVCIPGSHIYSSDSNLTMIANSTSMYETFCRLGINFKKLYKKRAYIHWFVGDGLEEDEFQNAFMNVGSLAQDYAEIDKDE